VTTARHERAASLELRRDVRAKCGGANTHRIVVHGSTTPLEWLRLTVDPRVNAPNGPDAFGPFSWQRVTE
jgi:hypothetical protein